MNTAFSHPAPPTNRISKTITQRWIPASSPPSTQYDKAALNPKTPPRASLDPPPPLPDGAGSHRYPHTT